MTARRFLKMEVIYGNKKNNQEVKLPLNIKNMEEPMADVKYI